MVGYIIDINFSFSDNYRRISQRADGHCLLHAVISAVNNTPELNFNINKSSIIRAIRREFCAENRQKYGAVIDRRWASQLEDYLVHRLFRNNPLADIMPMVISTAYNIEIRIVNNEGEAMFGEMGLIRPINNPSLALGQVVLTYENYHYETLVPIGKCYSINISFFISGKKYLQFDFLNEKQCIFVKYCT